MLSLANRHCGRKTGLSEKTTGSVAAATAQTPPRRLGYPFGSSSAHFVASYGRVSAAGAFQKSLGPRHIATLSALAEVTFGPQGRQLLGHREVVCPADRRLLPRARTTWRCGEGQATSETRRPRKPSRSWRRSGLNWSRKDPQVVVAIVVDKTGKQRPPAARSRHPRPEAMVSSWARHLPPAARKRGNLSSHDEGSSGSVPPTDSATLDGTDLWSHSAESWRRCCTDRKSTRL